MNYYYDLLLNFSEDYFNFYEWDENDTLDYIAKIPIYRVNEITLKDFFNYEITIEKNFLDLIKDKTLLKTKGLAKSISYALIITDTKSALALELNKEGKVICRSSLLLDDELNILEIGYSLKKVEVKYTKSKSLNFKQELRQISYIKKIIQKEIDILYEQNNLAKLEYLYLEWFNEKENEKEKIYQKMHQDLRANTNDKQIKIYNIIKLSYTKDICL